MPSSLIFVGLVVLWLLILVPTVARRQQEVARLSPALLSGRVLERPMRHRYPEVGLMERSAPSTVGELVEARGEVPGPRGRDYDDYDEFDTEIDDDGRVYGIDDVDDEWAGRERDPRPAADRHGHGPDDRDQGYADPDGRDQDARGLDGRDLDGRDLDTDPEPGERDGDIRAGHDDRDDPGDLDDYTNPRDRFVDDDLADHDFADHDFAGDDFAGDDAEVDDTVHDDRLDEFAAEGDEEHLPTRYRPGRGGFDPEAAAAAAHAKYAFRQRVVLALLVLLLAAGATALLVSTVFWWVAGALGLGLVGYLTYLRRQVRIEESIRSRRAARLTGARRAPAADNAEPDASAQREPDTASAGDEAQAEDEERGGTEQAEDDGDWTADDGEPSRVRGTGAPLGVLPARRRTVDGTVSTEHESSLPRLTVAPPPPLPAGTSLVDVDTEEEPDVLDDLTPHRRAVGE